MKDFVDFEKLTIMHMSRSKLEDKKLKYFRKSS